MWCSTNYTSVFKKLFIRNYIFPSNFLINIKNMIEQIKLKNMIQS